MSLLGSKRSKSNRPRICRLNSAAISRSRVSATPTRQSRLVKTNLKEVGQYTSTSHDSRCCESKVGTFVRGRIQSLRSAFQLEQKEGCWTEYLISDPHTPSQFESVLPCEREKCRARAFGVCVKVNGRPHTVINADILEKHVFLSLERISTIFPLILLHYHVTPACVTPTFHR